MVGFVMVSHSRKLAEGAVDLGLLMAPEVLAEAAGGLPAVTSSCAEPLYVSVFSFGSSTTAADSF